MNIISAKKRKKAASAQKTDQIFPDENKSSSRTSKAVESWLKRLNLDLVSTDHIRWLAADFLNEFQGRSKSKGMNSEIARSVRGNLNKIVRALKKIERQIMEAHQIDHGIAIGFAPPLSSLSKAKEAVEKTAKDFEKGRAVEKDSKRRYPDYALWILFDELRRSLGQSKGKTIERIQDLLQIFDSRTQEQDESSIRNRIDAMEKAVKLHERIAVANRSRRKKP